MTSHKTSTPSKGTLPLAIADPNFPLSDNPQAALAYYTSASRRNRPKLIYPIANNSVEEKAKEELEELNKPLPPKVEKRQLEVTSPPQILTKKKKIL